MKKSTTGILLALVLFVALTINGCGIQTAQNNSDGSKKITVTDMLGRQVSIAQPVEKVVAVGPGALRLYCYVDGINKLAGVEQMEKDDPIGKPYLLANPSLTSLPVIGSGGPNNAPDAEKILSVKPDVIFSTYNTDQSSVDVLQAKTGIPVVTLSYGQVSVFDPSVYQSLELIGEVVNQEQTAQGIVDYMEECRNDLDERTKDIPDDEKPSVYVGALSFRGTHGIESTQGKYALLEAINAKNVVDETGRTGSIMLDKEKIIQWDPDKIFIDLAGYSMVQTDYQKNTKFYGVLSAVKMSEMYSQLPYNYYNTNIGTAIANAYFLGKVIYPEQFSDVDPEKKADEIYQFLLGKPLYAQMAKDFGGFNKLKMIP